MKKYCWICKKKITDAEFQERGFLCKEHYDELNNLYNYGLKKMTEEYPHIDEATFLEVLNDFVELKSEQYDDVRRHAWSEVNEALRRRLKEEQNLCQR